MENLTKKQKEILDYIIQTIEEKGYPPTVREIAKEFSMASPRSVSDHLSAIERKGYIRRRENISRGIEVLEYVKRKVPVTDVVEAPLIGEIAAGRPILASENIEGRFIFDKRFVRSKDVFVLKVKGDSMIGAGLLDGDYVVVRQQPTAERGEIVCAIIDGEATIKRYYPEKDCIRLEPANQTFQPIIAKRDFVIAGKVIGLFRRY